ncbi:MAG: transglutaminaseTgpA domain-containing protein [Gammaproteobacteria bacterium]|nr:transglutaminaseTgpA domain-containing protein [Gammaproteobacteria bacterium]
MIRSISLHKQAEFWVLLPLFLVILPHFPRLPSWIIFLLPVFFAWRLLAIKNNRLLPARWLVACIAFLSLAGILLYYGTIFGRTAGTSLLCILLSIKLLESKKQRDYMLLIALAAFIIVTNFLFSQNIPTVIYMLLMVTLITMSLISINLDTTYIPVKKRLKMSASLVAQALPLMIILFLLFPRIPGSLWKLPDDKNSAVTGLSGIMSPGKISNLMQSDAVAFRVKFEHQIPEQNNLYWRGLILWRFDGETWIEGKQNKNTQAEIETISNKTEYSVTLEPHNRKWLFALDMPSQHPDSIIYNNNYLLRAKKDIASIYQYSIQSYLNYRIGHNLSEWEKKTGLKLPPNSNKKSIQLGIKWKNDLNTPEEIVKHALRYFNNENFFYTLEPPLTPGFDPVDQFLFETRKGFCEHYASSFTLLMRAAGIPARVVIGYQGGTINPYNNYLTVRQNDAHAWSEVWLENRGWVRIDPTAAVAPERVESNLNAALNPDESRPFYMHLNSGFLKQIGFYWDAIDNSWKQWIIAYDSTKQHRLLSYFTNKKINYYDIIIALFISLSVVAFITSLFIMKPLRFSKEDNAQKLYIKFCKKMARRGLIKKTYEGPVDFSQRAVEKYPEDKSTIDFFIRLYINTRYRSRQNKEQINKMKKLIKNL